MPEFFLQHYKPACHCKLHDAHGTPIFKTEALHYIDSKCQTRGLKSSRTCLIGHITPLVLYGLGGGHTHTQTHIHLHRSDFKKPGACRPQHSV